jgi:predicted transposase/invertase (TIGR01784 family)
MKFASPQNDLAFKKIFGDEHKTAILISFLNAILDFKGTQTIQSLTLADPYQVPKIPELKETILDIKAINRAGEKFIIEMQKKDLGDFAKRSLYYTAKAYVEQLDKNQNYSQLQKVYFIGILNFKMFDNDNYISRHLILDNQTKKQELADFEFTFLELPKFSKSLQQLDSVLDKWIYFLQNADNLEFIPKEYKDLTEFTDAFDTANQQTWNKKELEVYDYISLKEYDDINALKTAEDKGIIKGIEQERINIAKSLLDVLDDPTIANKTGLSIANIQRLRQDNKD